MFIFALVRKKRFPFRANTSTSRSTINRDNPLNVHTAVHLVGIVSYSIHTWCCCVTYYVPGTDTIQQYLQYRNV